MFDRAAVVYQYDGSLQGLLTCVFTLYERRREPVEIQPEDAPQEWLYPVEAIPADPGKAQRVYDAVGKKICPEAQEWLRTGFLYGEAGKEMAIYRFIRLGLREGAKTVRLFGHPDVAPLYAMIRAVENEDHLLQGFLRFSDLGGLLAAEIRPKHFVLPRLSPHFIDRYPEERFFIYDRTHQAVVAYQPYESRSFFVRDFQMPKGEEDARFRELWHGYFRAATVQARLNPLCQRTHCPKRYWACMSEMTAGNLFLEGNAPGGKALMGSAPPLIDKPSAGR